LLTQHVHLLLLAFDFLDLDSVLMTESCETALLNIADAKFVGLS
jgi:hypothetical protein